MIAAPLISALVPVLAGIEGVRRVAEADDLALLIAAMDLPQTTPAAFVLVTGEEAETLSRTLHTERVLSQLSVVLVGRPRATPQGQALGEIGRGVVGALSGRIPADDWTPLGYRGATQQVRAAARDRQGALFLTLHFDTTTTLRGCS
ncbi:phage tail terminator protein [Pararhodospirillum photometricum]|nr:hypothetical protein [Pararhodospirillum photometricum]